MSHPTSPLGDDEESEEGMQSSLDDNDERAGIRADDDEIPETDPEGGTDSPSSLLDAADAEDEPPGEDLFGDTMRSDYQPQPELDTYDSRLLDDSAPAMEAISTRERRRVERELDARDRQQRRRNFGPESSRDVRRPGRSRYYQGLRALMESVDDDQVEEQENEVWRLLRERRELYRAQASQAARLPIVEVDQAKEELPFCQSQAAWTPRIAEIMELVFLGFVLFYERPNVTLTRPSSEEQGSTANTSLVDANQTPGYYVEQISIMAHGDRSSLVVEWDDIRRYCPKVLDWIYQIPQQSLAVLDLVLTKVTLERYPKLYMNRRVSARVRGYDAIDSLRALNTEYLNYFISVRGVVVRRTNILPKLKLLYFECGRCQCNSLGPFEYRDGEKLKVKLVCEDCQATGPFSISREKTIYENYQKLIIQEPPGRATPGHVPRQKQVIVLDDLVDKARPGDEVVVTGIYQTRPDVKLNAKHGFPIFATQILATNLERRQEVQANELTDQDLLVIHELARNPHIREKLIDSIAPSLWGHRHIKTGLAYSMFGAVQRVTAGGHTVRGDINFLLLGDPGTGKSQFLKAVEKIADRAVYASGKGASAVGLTAAVKRDPVTGEWGLEGGALVLADSGICLIDEFDKMSDQDRVSIHEAMEQQSISISKAGIVATLSARCAVIAAANPVFGRYDSSLTFAENVDLSDPILSRFDVLAVVKDQVNSVHDENLAQHVVTSHSSCHPEADLAELTGKTFLRDLNAELNAAGNAVTDSNVGGDDDVDNDEVVTLDAKWVKGIGRIPQSMFKKYLSYARRNCIPELREHDESKLSQFYSELRQAASVGGGIPITVRHLESIIRMACANARMRLSSYVEKRDIDLAMSTMLESFIQSQKYAVAVSLGRRFGRFRAMASSPDEFVETVLVEVLNRKGREALRVHFRGRVPSPLTPEALEVAHAVEASLLELKTLTRTLYSIPEAAVMRYTETRRFKSQFIVTQNAERVDVVRRISIEQRKTQFEAARTAAPARADAGRHRSHRRRGGNRPLVDAVPPAPTTVPS